VSNISCPIDFISVHLRKPTAKFQCDRFWKVKLENSSHFISASSHKLTLSSLFLAMLRRNFMIIMRPQALFRSQKTLVVYILIGISGGIFVLLAGSRQFETPLYYRRTSFHFARDPISIIWPWWIRLANTCLCIVRECCAAKTISREINPDLCVFRDTCEAEVVPHFQTERLGIWLVPPAKFENEWSSRVSTLKAAKHSKYYEFMCSGMFRIKNLKLLCNALWEYILV